RLSVRLFGRRGLLLSQLLGLSITAALVAWAAVTGQLLLAAFFVLFGMQTVRLLQAYFRGEGPLDVAAEGPAHPELQAAEAHLAAGRLDEAVQCARTVLDDARVLAPTAGRAHLVLGWVALKEGQGRRALDHFSQVHGPHVPPHALAAAFSLLGDEAKALPVWEMAWQQTADTTILHEWAGSLLRAQQPERVRRLPGVDLATAWQFATRVPFLRGAYSEAAVLGEEALREVPRADLAYDAACAHARAGNVERALWMLEQAVGLGFRDGVYAASDEDLARLHGHPGFDAWRSRLVPSAAA
ncbi:MAG: peptidase M50, partial [Myxococcaceae bacterium]|nr:peptidase M50 [Myxococcaceae bacterium]